MSAFGSGLYASSFGKGATVDLLKPGMLPGHRFPLFSSGSRTRFHVGNQAVAHFGNGFDDARMLAIIAEGPTQLVDGVGEGFVPDNDARPYGFEQHFPAYWLPRMRCEICQQSSGFGFEFDVSVAAFNPVRGRLQNPACNHQLFDVGRPRIGRLRRHHLRLSIARLTHCLDNYIFLSANRV